MFASLLFLALTSAAAPQEAGADGKEGFDYLTQRYLEEVGIDEMIGAQLPLDLKFTDHKGLRRSLGDVFGADGRPVVLTFNYASCPSLCKTQLDGFCSTLADLEAWQAGDRFRIVTVSIDHTETTERAAEVRADLLEKAGIEIDPTQKIEPWTYLTGSEDDIRSLADAAGFRFRYDRQSGEYLHGAALILCTAEGEVGRYLYRIPLPAQTLRLGLAETAAGEFRSTSDRVLLFCFRFDPAANSYALAAWNLTRIFLALFALGLGGFLLRMFRQERRLRTQLDA